MLKYNDTQETELLSRMYYEGTKFERSLCQSYRFANKWDRIKIEAMFSEYFEKWFQV